MNKAQAAKKKAEWLAYCLEIGFSKDDLDGLSECWDRFKDEYGNLRPKTESHPLPSTTLEQAAEAYAIEEVGEGSDNINDPEHYRFKQLNTAFKTGAAIVQSMALIQQIDWDVLSRDMSEWYLEKNKNWKTPTEILTWLRIHLSKSHHQSSLAIQGDGWVSINDDLPEIGTNNILIEKRNGEYDVVGCFSHDAGVWGRDEVLRWRFIKDIPGHTTPKPNSIEDEIKRHGDTWDAAYMAFDGSGGPADDFIPNKETYLQSLTNKLKEK